LERLQGRGSESNEIKEIRKSIEEVKICIS
jgi:hypothetical protein